MSNPILTVEDIPFEGFREIPVGRNYIQYLFNQPGWSYNLNKVLRTMRDFTSLTEREVAVEYFTSFSRSSAPRYQISHLELVVPSLGDQDSVANPELTGNENILGSHNGVVLYVPLLHIHTHPRFSRVFPSKADLSHMIDNQLRFWSLKGNHYKMFSSPLNIIAGPNNKHFFWRIKGDYTNPSTRKEIDDFVKGYDPDLHLEEEVAAKRMNESGVITAYYHNDYQRNIIAKKDVKRIAETFAPFTIRVGRAR